MEREAILGGTATNAFVNIWRPVTGANGIARDLFLAMARDPMGVTLPPGCDLDAALRAEPARAAVHQRERTSNAGPVCRSSRGRWTTPLAACWTPPARCRTLLGTTFCRAEVDGATVKAVEAWFPGKRIRIEADVFIDCTADGDVCVDAGCEYHMGEDPKSRYGEPHAPEQAELVLNGLTLCYRITDTGVKQKPYLPDGAREGGSVSACYDRMPNGDVIINVCGMIGGNAVVCMEYSELMHEAHRRVLAHMYRIQQLPADDPWAGAAGGKGWGTWAISAIAPRIGVRETRRMVTEYVLTENDCVGGLARQKHKDVVTIADHSIDIHGRGHLSLPFPSNPFGIPYRCLLPRGMHNLMIASRAAGFSHIASGAARLQRTLITLGQAAGNAAAIAAHRRIGVGQVDVAELQAILKKQRVDIAAPPEPALSG